MDVDELEEEMNNLKIESRLERINKENDIEEAMFERMIMNNTPAEELQCMTDSNSQNACGRGESDLKLQTIESEFSTIRNVFNYQGYGFKTIHKCLRVWNCPCQPFLQFILLYLYHHPKYFLSLFLSIFSIHILPILNQYFCAPSIYLPFQSFILWLQLEIYRKQYLIAKDLIKTYIKNTKQIVGKFYFFEKFQENMDLISI
jgi:hypothetical protein